MIDEFFRRKDNIVSVPMFSIFPFVHFVLCIRAKMNFNFYALNINQR